MQLFDLIRNKKVLSEGGNVSSQSPGWQGAADQEAEEIDLKIHNRDHMVNQLRTLLAAQNESFKAAYGKYIWDPKLLDSGKMFSGSSLQFFDVKGVNTQDFLNKLKKTKVGDIDTQIDQDMGDEVTAWLKSIIGKKVGNGTFLGFNSSLSSIWLLDDPQVRIQVDYELGPYQPAQGKEPARPTEWFAYSHSSHYDDMAAGIKGVFHKYINRALTHSQKSTKYVARVLKKGVKIGDEPVTDSDYSFAVTSAQGGGMSIKYKPYIDPATGQPMEKDGIPVMQSLDPKDRDYIQNLDQQFQMTYGRKRGAADKNLQGSFVGTLQLMNKSFTPDQNEAVARAFLDILFGPGAQMITKDDPVRDRDIKFAAVDAMLLGGDGIKPLNLPNGKGLRQEAVDMAMNYANAFKAKAAAKTPVNEAEVKAQLRKGMPHLRDLKPADFLDLIDELRSEGGRFKLQNIPLNVKIDGFGGRFGKNADGKPFMGTSRTEPRYSAGFVDYHKEKGTTDPDILGRAVNFDKMFNETMAAIKMVDSKLGADFLVDKQVTCEVLFLPFATQTDEGKLKFVGIEYDQLPKGVDLVLVPYRIVQASTGEDIPDGDAIVQQIAELGQSGNVMFMSNRLVQKDGLDVTEIINPLENLEELKRIVSDTAGKRDRASLELRREVETKLKPVQIALEKAIDEDPNIVGKNNLGQDYEGIVINSRLGPIKVTSQRQKDIISQKNAAKAAARADQGRDNSNKTAVVAIGSFVGHKGHEELFNYTIEKAKEVGGDPYLFMGNAVGKDDPIPVDVKLQTWHKMYPQYAKNISGTMAGGTLMQKIKHELINPLPGKPPRYDNIIIMVGEDQQSMPIAGALMKAVNKFQGYEHVKVSLEATPRGTGMSFTKLRNVLKDPNATPEQQYTLWAQGFDEEKLGKDWILHLMDISRKGMGIVQKPAPAPKPAPQPVAEQRLLNALIRPRKPIAELSSEKLGQYKKAAGAQASAADKIGDTKKADKRFSGIVKATKKQFANDEKGVAEANPNQQIARYNPDGATYRGMTNKMPTLDPRDPVHNADRFGLDHDEPYDHDDDYDRSELKRVMAKQMSNLGDQAQEILKARYWDNLTYAEIGAELGISAERVRQVEAKALRKLKHPSRADSLAAFIEESVAVEPDPKGYQKDLLTNPKNALVIDTPGDLDWYKLGQHYPTLGTDDPHEYGQGDSDMVIVPYSKQELVDLKQKLDRLKMRYKDIGGSHEQPEIHDKVEQEHIVKVKGGYELKSKHGNKNLGKYPTKAGAEKRERQVQYFKHAGESVDNKCVPVSEDVENIMGALIESILKK
jgi:RNA polymerase sigma factor (sigma-70 family)